MPFDDYRYYDDRPFGFGWREAGHYETYEEPCTRKRVRWVSECEQCQRRIARLEQAVEELEKIHELKEDKKCPSS